MCFLLQVYNYLRIRLKLKKYLKRKELAKIGIDHEPKKFKDLKYRINLVKNCYKTQKRKFNKGLLRRISISRTFENFVFLAIVGWLIGTLFTIFHFYLEIYMGEATVFWSFMVRMPLLVLVTVSVAFTETGRCYLLLSPLQIFSTSGQVYIAGVVMVLVMEGPVANLRHNLNVIQESGTCQQRGISVAAAEIADILFGPFSSFRQAAKEIIDGIKTMVDKLQNILRSFKTTVMAVADAIQDATKWINSKINGCKNTVGTTYDHCMQAFTWMYDECKVSVPSVFVKMCVVTEFASNLCSSVKPGEYLCDLVFFSIDPLVTTINQRISRLWDRAYTLMYFDVNIHHEFSLESNTKSIADELKNKLMSVFENATLESIYYMSLGIVNVVLQFYFLLAVCRYRSKYLKRENFDNYYISKKLKSVDLVESLKGPESIFPLRRIEKKKYINVSSYYLVKKELKAFSFPYIVLLKTFIVLILIGVDIVLNLVAKKCRVFMLAIMETFGSRPEINIVGSGFIAELSRRVIRSLNYMDSNFFHEHFLPCLPNPKRPNKLTIYKIIILLVMLWCSWIIKPYALRFRHKIMDYYEPTMADRRVRWLYNKIYFNRVTFVSLVRIKLKAKFGKGGKNISIADILRARYPWLTHIIGKGVLSDQCMICNHLKPPLYHCPTLNCPGIYCDDCYINIQGICSLCKENMMLEDFKHLKFESTGKGDALFDEDAEEIEGFLLIKEDEDLDFSYQRGFDGFQNIPEYRKLFGQNNGAEVDENIHIHENNVKNIKSDSN